MSSIPEDAHDDATLSANYHAQLAAVAEAMREKLNPIPMVPVPPSPSDEMTDSERWEWMFGWQTGEDIRALYDGNTYIYGKDHSKADQALCNTLAFATRHESENRASIIDRMFRQSGLYWTQWEWYEYRSRIIKKALDSYPYEPLLHKRRKSSQTGPNGEPLPDFTTNNPNSKHIEDTTPVLFEIMGAKTYGEEQYHQDVEIYSRSNDRKTGFANIDEHGAFRPGLYCVGAISSLGKSTFCLQLADNLAAAGEHVLFFSAEQDQKSMHAKSVARYLYGLTRDPDVPSALELKSGVTGDKVREAEVAYHQAVEDRMCVIPVRSKLRPKDLDYTVRSYADKIGKPPVVIVDYLQRMKPDNPRDIERMALNHAVATMQDLVLELGATVIGVSSLNRAGYLQPITFESFKGTGDIEFDSDVVWGLDLGCMSAPLFTEDKETGRKRKIIKQAKREIPREVRLVCMKNRDGEPSYDALFYYYPKHDFFESLTGSQIVTDEYGDVDFKAPKMRRSWRNMLDKQSGTTSVEARFGDNDASPTGQFVILTTDMVREWSAGDAQKYFIGITPPEHRNDLRRMLPSQAKKVLMKKLADGPKRFATYTDTPKLPA